MSVISGEQYRLIEPLVCYSTMDHAPRKKVKGGGQKFAEFAGFFFFVVVVVVFL